MRNIHCLLISVSIDLKHRICVQLFNFNERSNRVIYFLDWEIFKSILTYFYCY